MIPKSVHQAILANIIAWVTQHQDPRATAACILALPYLVAMQTNEGEPPSAPKA